MRFSDGGWMSMKDSFETGSLISFLTTLLYAAGAALAMFLAVYLYVGRNKKSYAIMRTLGVPGNKAQNSIVLPLIVLSIFAIPAGGVAGLFQASNTAAKALADMAESAPYGYVPDTALPLRVILLCLTLLLRGWKLPNFQPPVKNKFARAENTEPHAMYSPMSCAI